MAGNSTQKPIRRSPRHIRLRQNASSWWIRKYSTPVAGAHEHVWLLWIGRALDARAEPRIKSANVHDETEAQRLFPGAAQLGAASGALSSKLNASFSGSRFSFSII